MYLHKQGTEVFDEELGIVGTAKLILVSVRKHIEPRIAVGLDGHLLVLEIVAIKLLTANTLLVGLVFGEFAVLDDHELILRARIFHEVRLLVDGAESHVHTVLIGGGVLLESLADAAVLVGEYLLGRSDALHHNLRQYLRTNHTHERARHTVSRTIGGGDDDAVFRLGKPVIIAADDVLGAE